MKTTVDAKFPIFDHLKKWLEHDLMNPITDLVVGTHLSLLGVKLYINPELFSFLSSLGTFGERFFFWTATVASTVYAVSRAYLSVKEVINQRKNERDNKEALNREDNKE